MNQILEVVVSPTGATRVQTQGFVGSRCQDASRFLEAALGQRMHEERTPEFYQQSVTDSHLREAGDR